MTSDESIADIGELSPENLDPRERRKVKNRIAQRNYRTNMRRKMAHLERQVAFAAAGRSSMMNVDAVYQSTPAPMLQPYGTPSLPFKRETQYDQQASAVEASRMQYPEAGGSGIRGFIATPPEDVDQAGNWNHHLPTVESGSSEGNRNLASAAWVGISSSFQPSNSYPAMSDAQMLNGTDVIAPQLMNEEGAELKHGVDRSLPAGALYPGLGAKGPSGTDGKSPLHLAVEFANLEIVELLLERGASVNGRCVESQTPLHVAAMKGNLELVELFLGRGAVANVRDVFGRTPLHFACRQGNTVMADMLLRGENDLNRKDIAERSALHYAVEFCHIDIVRMLLEKGAAVN